MTRPSFFARRSSLQRGGRLVLFCLIAAALARGGPPASTTAPASLPTTSRPAGLRPFQPGVMIDWSVPAVHVAGEIVLRDAPLELFACTPGKEHESIVRINATCTAVYQALGLIGVSTGAPPQWEDATQTWRRATGGLVAVSVDWRENGAKQSAPASAWLREIEYDRVADGVVWAFAGSKMLPDGTLAADRTGAAITLVDFPESLLGLPAVHSSSNAELWARTNTAAIPPLDTPVTLILAPARVSSPTVDVDFRGVATIDGRYIDRAPLADRLRLALAVGGEPPTIRLHGTLQSDEAALRAELAAADASPEKLRWVRD